MKKNLGISAKISFINGLIILIIFSVSSFFFLYFESDLIDNIIEKYSIEVENTIDEQGKIQKESLSERMKTNINIFSKISSTFIYNYDKNGLKSMLMIFMDFAEIQAIQITDHNRKPFMAAWTNSENSEIEIETSIPNSFELKEKKSQSAECFYDDFYGTPKMVGYVEFYFTEKFLNEQIVKSKKKALRNFTIFNNIIEKNFNKSASIQIIIILFSVALLIITLVLCMKTIVIKPITRTIKKLSNGIQMINSSSETIASGGDKLAKDTAEQAALMEEISSAMEEISSMAEQNSVNSGHAESLTGETEKIVQSANTSLQSVTFCMEEIAEAGKKTRKIIKNIDEIAFQTNLLALNAAVEAARAGEAGAGFAIVADEVRNLAMRSAEASTSTAELIEDTVSKVEEGFNLINLTNKDFEQVVQSSVKVKELAGDISAASKDQTGGIEQVTESVTQAGDITQQNASMAEESASASQELFSQAEELLSAVDELTILIGGKN